MMTSFFVRCVFAGSLFLASLSPALSEPARENDAGQFDFYVLSLSWSPSFCAAAAERGNGRGPTPQCGPRPYSFVVHGLWPQYDKGFPEYCEVPAPRLNRGIVSSMLDLMPAPRLIYNEWDKHGTCSGLAARDYFDTVRKAREAIKIPAAIWRPARTAQRYARCGAGGVHQSQPGIVRRQHGRRMRQEAIDGSEDLPVEGAAVSRL